MITVQVNGLAELQKKLGDMASELEDTIQAAGEEVAKRVILPTEGLQVYPPETDANQPPTPFYIRGRGMERGGTRVPEYNDMSSERLGTRWVVERAYKYAVRIGNSASYAPFVHGREQATFMAAKGWLMLEKVVQDQIRDIAEVYQAWIDRLIRNFGK
jgi:hypothetical protein